MVKKKRVIQTQPENIFDSLLKQLSYFHFKRAFGGHANDGDSLDVGFIYIDRNDLIAKLNQIGITLNILPVDNPRPIIGKSYPGLELHKFKWEIKEYNDLEQPGWTIILGYKVHIDVSDNRINISVMGTKDGNLYEVTEDDIQVCLKLEQEFDKLGWKDFLYHS